MTPKIAMTLYRGVSTFPPAPKDYRTYASRGRMPPEDASEDDLRGWNALSSWISAELAHNAAAGMLSAKYIVRYRIPDGAGVRFEPSPPDGHWHIWDDSEELHGYLDQDFKEEVRRKENQV